MFYRHFLRCTCKVWVSGRFKNSYYGSAFSVMDTHREKNNQPSELAISSGLLLRRILKCNKQVTTMGWRIDSSKSKGKHEDPRT